MRQYYPPPSPRQSGPAKTYQLEADNPPRSANPSRLKVAVVMIHITQQQRPLKGLNCHPFIIAILKPRNTMVGPA